MDQFTLSHLSEKAAAMIGLPDAERIYAIQQGTWLGYPGAKEVDSIMEDMLRHPKVTRMPNLLLVAHSFNGKSSILQRFVQKHAKNCDAALSATVQPVVLVEAPERPEVDAMYARILDALDAPYRLSASRREMHTQIHTLFKNMGTKMLIIDEIHHLISGGKVKQAEFRNALKSLGNEAKISIVAAGIPDAYNAFSTDPQMISRFRPYELPLFRPDRQFASLLATLEQRTPLKHPSNLKDPKTMMAIHAKSEGTIGDMCDLFKELAIEAIRTGVEYIDADSITNISWVPPSKRRQRPRL